MEWRAGHAYDAEIFRLGEIWHAEYRRLSDQADEGRSTLSPDERLKLVGEMPECKEHDRLLKLHGWEREVISRGITAHQSARSIAKLLGRSPSTVSR